MPPAPHSSVRPPNRHSGEGRNPEGWGGGDCSAEAFSQLRADRSFAHVAPPGVPPFSSSYAAFARPWRFRLSPESRGAGRGECSAGACPPLGWGVAESAVQIRCTKPQLRLFIPSYENRWHPLDLPVSSFRRRPESRGVAGVARTAPKPLHQPPRSFHTLVCRRQPA